MYSSLYEKLLSLKPASNNTMLSLEDELFVVENIKKPMTLINKEIGNKTSILHLLVEREQVFLIEKFFQVYRDLPAYEWDWSMRDSLNKTIMEMAIETGNEQIIEIIKVFSAFFFYVKRKSFLCFFFTESEWNASRSD